MSHLEGDISAAIAAMVDAVNKGEFAVASAHFASEVVIVEDLAPFRWQGPDAVSHWLAAMGANAARLDLRAITMTLVRTVRMMIENDRAYAVCLGELEYTTASGKLTALGHLTFTLAKRGRWLIETLVWSGPETAPVA